MKSVCVVGAGPAGLAATKTLLETGRFTVSTYEKRSRIGGIWDLDENSTDGVLSPLTPTNLSRFAVSFSDLDWNSVDLRSTKIGLSNAANGHGQTTAPMFPKAWMVNRYLREYRKRYIPDGIITFDCEIVGARRSDGKWCITTSQKRAGESTKEFDYLVVATGFFGSPRSIRQNVPGVSKDLKIPTIHSANFRSLDKLFAGVERPAGRNILLIGGGNSAGEAAAAVAMQLSDAQWSPDQTGAARYKDCRVIHITPRPFYAIPPFLEIDKGSRSYIPLDFRLYDFSRRPAGQPSYAGQQPPEVIDIVHSTIETFVGGDQSDLSDVLVSQKSKGRLCAYAALTEGYSEFVRSGLIELAFGRVATIEHDSGDVAFATVQNGEDIIRIDNIGAVVYATGYTPRSSLDFLDDAVQRSVGFDSTNMRLPLILEQWQTANRSMPEVSFLGFYEGPYWGIIEMQARLTAHRWLQDSLAPTKPFEDEQALTTLRQAMHDKAHDVPQYWFSDYVGYMEDIASELGLKRNDGQFDIREGCTLPARYISSESDHNEANSTMREVHTIWHDCETKGKYVPRAAFRALQGSWKISRRIESAIPTIPSGIFEGTAHFHPRYPTTHGTGASFDFEYLYVECGTFTSSTGSTLMATRRYVYRYSEANDQLSVWFTKPSNELEVDYLFHNLDFVNPEEARKAGAVLARADHLCEPDMYWTEYRLPLEGVALREFELKHRVKGPEKDYVATATYRRTPRSKQV